jgi:hypothetical protein
MPRGRPAEKELCFVEIKPLICCKYLIENHWQLAQKCNEKFECPICLEEIKDKHSFALCVCGHTLHFDCYFWSKNRNQCPVCKYGTSEDESEN